jgi:hypothetical protein
MTQMPPPVIKREETKKGMAAMLSKQVSISRQIHVITNKQSPGLQPSPQMIPEEHY